MAIREYVPADAPDLSPLYNAQVAEAPFCFDVSSDVFADQIRDARAIGRECDLRDERLLVAMNGGEPGGFAHIGRGKASESWTEDRDVESGVIRFLTYPRGRRSIGQALLEVCETRLNDAGETMIHAFSKPAGYSFYQVNFGMLSDRLSHVVGLLGMNGYEVRRGEIFMYWPNFDPSEPSPPDGEADIRFNVKAGDGDLPNFNVQARFSDRYIGECECVSAAHHAKSPEAQKMCFVGWLGVEDELQGNGWGRYLLGRALWEGKRLGYEHAGISTDRRNYRALLFYTNYGFRVVSVAYDYRKEFGGSR